MKKKLRIAITAVIAATFGLYQIAAATNYVENNNYSYACRDEDNACSGNPFSHNFDYKMTTTTLCAYDSTTGELTGATVTQNCEDSFVGCCWFEHEDNCPPVPPCMPTYLPPSD